MRNVTIIGPTPVITVQATEAAEVSFSLAGFTEVGAATATLGTAAAMDVGIGVGVAAEDALLDGL